MKYLEDKRRKLAGQTQTAQGQAKAATQSTSQAPAKAQAAVQQENVVRSDQKQKQTQETARLALNTTPAQVQSSAKPQLQSGGIVEQAQQYLNEQLSGYSSRYGSQISDLVEQLQDRPAFDYDVSTDPMYLRLRDIWKQDGLMAMEDTMGQAAQLTGGYGNSHAQILGQQAYQGYMRQFNSEMVPQLKEAARADYDAENAALLQKLSLLMDQEDQDYSRWQDELARQQYEEELAYSREQDKYAKEQNAYDRLAELIASTGYAPTAEELAAAGMTESQAKAWKGYYNQSVGGASGGGSASSSFSGQGANIDDYEVDEVSVAALGIDNITPAQLDALVNQGEVEEYVEDGKYKYRWKNGKKSSTSTGGSGNGRGNRDKWQISQRD